MRCWLILPIFFLLTQSVNAERWLGLIASVAALEVSVPALVLVSDPVPVPVPVSVSVEYKSPVEYKAPIPDSILAEHKVLAPALVKSEEVCEDGTCSSIDTKTRRFRFFRKKESINLK